MVSCGSSDKYLNIWDTTSRKTIHKLGGHMGSINDVSFSKVDNLIVSASSDKTLIVS